MALLRAMHNAPKDGTQILIWSKSWNVACWREDAEHGEFREAPGWQVFYCDGDHYYSYCVEEPLGWLPLPEI